MFKIRKKLSNRLPRRALTNLDIIKHTIDVPYFRGVFMKNGLPKTPKHIECAIVNLDNSENPGTHWVAYIKIYDYCEYFNSFGNLRPPEELLIYLKMCNVYYNYNVYQNFNTVNCGHLCIKYLKKFWCSK